MNIEVLEKGLSLLREGVETNIEFILNMAVGQQKAEKAQKDFQDWIDENPEEAQYLADNFVE